MRPFVAAVLAAALATGAVACGGDDETGDGAETAAPVEEETTTVPTGDDPTATIAPEGVSLTATVRLDRRRVLFDYTLANTGAEPVAVVDTGSVIDTLDPLGDGGYRAAFLRSEADATAGAPLPFLRGVVVAAGARLTGTAGITGQFEDLPPTVELCIEVAPQPWTDKGDGVAEFPYRAPGTPPVLACTGQLAVPPAG